MMGILAFFALLHFGKGFLVPIVSSVILSFALYTVVLRFERWGFPRFAAILAVLFIVMLVLSGILVLIGVQFSGFITDIPVLLSQLEVVLANTQQFITDRFKIAQADQLNLLRSSILDLFSTSTSIITTTISTTSNLLFDLVLIPIYVFFMLYYRDQYYNFMIEMSPKGNEKTMARIMGEVKDVVRRYITGISLVIFILAILYVFGLLIIGIKYAVFFGVFTALLSIIPYFGVFLGAFITSTYTFLTTQSPMMTLAVLGMYGIIQFLEGNFITPLVIGGRVSLNPFAVILSLLLGGFIWGAAGLILAVPMIAITKMICDNVESLRPLGKLLGTRQEEVSSIIQPRMDSGQIPWGVGD